nr:hypothetical protein [Tanacetum cinerariifolium]
MSTSTHPIIIPSNSDMEDVFSSTNILNYTSTSPNYSPASPRNTFSDTSDDPSEDQLVLIAVSPFCDDPYMQIRQAYDVNQEFPIPPPQAPIAPPTVLPQSLVLPPSSLFDPRDFFLPECNTPIQHIAAEVNLGLERCRVFRRTRFDKEVTRVFLDSKVVMEVVGWLFGGDK